MDARAVGPETRPGGARPKEGPGFPRPTLGLVEGVALVIGIVVGAGIFRSPPAVAANASSTVMILAVWGLGGLVSLAGAMCYAELAATYPHAGGDYHYLSRALGRGPAFLFAWARLTVIPTGSLALLAFVGGDYAAQLVGHPSASAGIAAAMVVAVTLLNVAGLRIASRAQVALTVALVGGLLLVIATGLAVPATPAVAEAAPVAAAPAAGEAGASLGLAMVFVLLAYGGWNEAAYVSTELRGGRRSIAKALTVSLGIITALYLLANVAYLRGLGLAGVRESTAVASDLLERGIGPVGASIIAVIVIAGAVTSANATLFLGARMSWAFGREFPPFAPLGRWSGRSNAPVNAILLQGTVALGLVALGAMSRGGFEAMVAYTAPVFWLFLLLTGISLFVLRWRDPGAPRPFRVPLYPLTPIAFCAACAYLLWSSVAYAGPGAIAGLAVLGSGIVPLWLSLRGKGSGRPVV
jgi:basic amino acid/polyamine antiporter, APA family